MHFNILRPPLAKSLALPAQEKLLELKIGDNVKLVFQVAEDDPERMWVKITEQQTTDEWTGKIDNNPFQESTAKTLPEGTIVKFHPLNIIQIWEEK